MRKSIVCFLVSEIMLRIISGSHERLTGCAQCLFFLCYVKFANVVAGIPERQTGMLKGFSAEE